MTYRRLQVALVNQIVVAGQGTDAANTRFQLGQTRYFKLENR